MNPQDMDRTNLIEAVQEFLIIAKEIENAWESGDLAGAVTDLTSYAATFKDDATA